MGGKKYSETEVAKIIEENKKKIRAEMLGAESNKTIEQVDPLSTSARSSDPFTNITTPARGQQMVLATNTNLFTERLQQKLNNTRLNALQVTNNMIQQYGEIGKISQSVMDNFSTVTYLVQTYRVEESITTTTS